MVKTLTDTAQLLQPPNAETGTSTHGLANLDMQIFESSLDCVAILDRNGLLLSMNRRGQAAMEVDDVETVAGLPWLRLWPEESHGVILAALDAARRGEKSQFQASSPALKGTPKWWEVLITPIYDHAGNIELLLSVSRDITELKQLKENLQATQDSVQFLIQSANIAYWEVDLATNHFRCSGQHPQLYGFPASNPKGNIDTFFSRVHPDDQPRVRKAYEEALRECANHTYECRIVCADHSVHWICVHGTIDCKNGKAIRVHGTVEDITAQKRAELLVLGQKKALQLTIQGEPLQNVLTVLASTAEAQSGGNIFASILVLDKEGQHLHHGAAPSLPAAFCQAIDGVAIGPNVGSCGTAAFRREVVLVRDIQADPLWADYRDLAAAHQLRACWSTPILTDGGKLLGTFAFYYREARDPTPDEREAMTLLVNTAALVLDRHQEAERHQTTFRALQDTRDRLETTLAAGEVVTWTWDMQTNRMHGDRNLARLCGQPHLDHIDVSIDSVRRAISPEDLPLIEKTVERAIREGKPFEARYRLDVQGQHHSVITRGRVQFNDAGIATRMLGVTLDVTSQYKAEVALNESESRYRTLFELMDQGFCLIEILFDEAGDPYDIRFLESNLAYTKLTGVAGIAGKKVSEVYPDLETYWIDIYARVARTGIPVRFENEFKPIGRWFDIYASRLGAEPGNLVAVLFTDITERKQAEQEVQEFNAKLEQQANYDTLTGLPNRRLFRDRLDQEIRHAQADGRRVALLFLDLDRFKEVNDLLGHDAGDTLLKKVAERLESCLRSTDTIARLGGDEFTIILTDPRDVDKAGQVAQQILDALSQPIRLHNEQVYVSCSIGITFYPEDALLAEDLVRNADQAMYRAKAAGRSQLSFFQHSMQAKAKHRLKRIADLRQAVPNRQLELYFQPIIELETGRIIKAEALVRWNHPEEGRIGPLEFIGLAEETGLIHEIGDWVFMEAVSCCKRWSQVLGRPFQVGINKSPIQFFQQADSLDWEAHLQKENVGSGSIVVEITEGLLLNLTDPVLAKMERLRQAGIVFSIDDFGTGYSSMSYLKKLDIDYLKVDQSFVRDMLQDETTATIVETVIMMAHKLGIRVVAEGIETSGQRDWLKMHGCGYGQGYLFSKPLPIADFENLLFG